MTLRSIGSSREIRAAQRDLQVAFRAGASASSNRKLGYQGGNIPALVSWNEQLSVWMGFVDMDDRFWNSFGLGDPFSSPAIITVQIIPPKEGIDRRFAGAFAVDDDGEVYVVHRGNIGGGKKGVGKTAFLDWWSGPVQPLDDEGRVSDVIVVGRIGEPHFLAKLAEFVRSVAEFKASARGNAGSPVTGGKRLDTFTPERTEPRAKTKLALEIQAQSDHGVVVRALHDELARMNIDTYNDRARDLYVGQGRTHFDTLFEVKTSSASSDVHQAVGQLMFHGRERAKRLVTVLPDDLSMPQRARLAELSVEVLVYSWRGQQVVFPDLQTMFARPRPRVA